jgi:hypothetical protein
VFFFEKKNQKTFVCLDPRKLESVRLRWHERRSKSFLLLFFKKEGLPFFERLRVKINKSLAPINFP